MELTWCQVEEVGLKAAFILQGSRERHKVVIGSRSKWKFLSLPPQKKMLSILPHQINSPHSVHTWQKTLFRYFLQHGACFDFFFF